MLFLMMVEQIFFNIKRNENDFSKASPFLVHKAIDFIVGEAKNIKKLWSGELLIELKTDLQASKLKKNAPYLQTFQYSYS